MTEAEQILRAIAAIQRQADGEGPAADAIDAGADALALLREMRHQKHSSCDCGIADEIFDQIDALLTRAGR